MALGERSRNPFRPRSTAEAVASLRAAGAFERDATVRCPDGLAREFLGGFNLTSLARRRLTRLPVVWAVERKSPGTYPYMVARCRVIDEIVLAELRAGGLDRVVVLGAGLDSLAYRLADQLSGVRVLEVDHPSSQASKQSKLCRIFGALPEHVEFVGIDFAHESLGERLAAAGYDQRAATLFIWAGVSMYLAESAVAAVLQWVSGHEHPRTSIVFDACWAEVVEGSREYYGASQWRRGVAAMGEPLRWGIPEGRIDETLASYGLRPETVYGPVDLATRYLARRDGSSVGRPYGCSAIIHARPCIGSQIESSRGEAGCDGS